MEEQEISVVPIEIQEQQVNLPSYSLDTFIDLMEKFVLYQEQIEVNLPSALYMLAKEIKFLKSHWEID